MRAEKTLKKCFRNPPCGQEKRLKRVFLADFESFDRNGGAPATPRAAEPGPHRFDQMLGRAAEAADARSSEATEYAEATVWVTG